MAAGKKTRAGKAKRCKLAEEWLGPDVVVLGRGTHPKKHVADDDILDAIAALWTATRIVHGKAQTLPKSPPMDSIGLPMEMVY
jgi:predicted RNase H-like nuclease